MISELFKSLEEAIVNGRILWNMLQCKGLFSVLITVTCINVTGSEEEWNLRHYLDAAGKMVVEVWPMSEYNVSDLGTTP